MISIGHAPSVASPWLTLSTRAGGQRRAGTEILLVDGLEIASRSCRSSDAARSPPPWTCAKQRAAGRRPGPGPCRRPQELRRQPGIVGRRHPDVEAGGDRRGAGGEVRRQRRGATRSRQSGPASIAAITRRIDQHRAQPPRVAPGQRRDRPADPQPRESPPARCAGAPPTAVRRRGRAVCSAGRSIASNGRCARPLDSSMRRRAASRSGQDDRARRPARPPPRSPAPNPARTAACAVAGRPGSRSNSASDGKQRRRAPAAGHAAGHTSSHASAARASRSRARQAGAAGAAAIGSSSASQSGTVSSAEQRFVARPRPDHREAAARHQHLGHQRPACCRSSSSSRHRRRRYRTRPGRLRPAAAVRARGRRCRCSRRPGRRHRPRTTARAGVRLAHRHDVVHGLVQRRPDQIVHRRVEDDDRMVGRLLDVIDRSIPARRRRRPGSGPARRPAPDRAGRNSRATSGGIVGRAHRRVVSSRRGRSARRRDRRRRTAMPVAAQRAHQLGQALEGRRGWGPDRSICEPICTASPTGSIPGRSRGEAIGGDRVVARDAEFVALAAGRDVVVAAGVDIGIDPDRDPRGLAARRPRLRSAGATRAPTRR